MRKLILVTGFILMGLALETQAAFNLGGTTITQTGTDADLSGLAALGGVTTTVTGTGVNQRTIYSIGNRRLVINGTLNIDPETEAVYAGTGSPPSVFRISGTGTLNVNGAIVENGVTRYSERLFMWSSYQSGNCCGNYGLQVENGGNLNWEGGAMRIGSALSFDGGANVTTTGAILFQDQNADNQLRQSSANWTCNSLRFTGNDITFIAIPAQLNGYSPVGARGALGFSGSTPNVDFPVRGFNTNGSSDSDVRFWSGSRPILTNAVNGSDMIAVPHVSGSGTSYGVAIVQQEVQMSLADAGGAPIVGASVFTRDTNNGGRETYNQEGHNVNATADRTYFQTTDGAGQTPVYTIQTAFNIVNNGNGDAANTGNYAWDYRGKNNDASDLFDFHVWSYNHLYASIEGELKGDTTKALSTTLFADTNISESTLATVNGYTTIDTLDRLYDRAKAWKVEAANIEYPAIAWQVIDANGTELDLGSKNLVVDGTAGSAFAINTGTNTITINAGTMSCAAGKFKSITTTGTIVFQNGASEGDCIITDTNGSIVSLEISGLVNGANVVVKDGATTLAQGVSTGTSLTLKYTGTSFPISATVYADKDDYIAKNAGMVIISTGGTAFIGMSADGFYTGSTPANVPTYDYPSRTITLTGNISIQELYNDLKRDLALTANIDETTAYPSTTNGATWIIPWSIAGTGNLTGSTTIDTTTRQGGTGTVGVPTTLVVNSLQTLNFPNGSLVKVLRVEDSAEIVALAAQTSPLVIDPDAWATTSKAYRVYVKEANKQPFIAEYNAATGNNFTITPVDYANNTVPSGGDVSAITSQLTLTRSASTFNGGETLDIGWPEGTLLGAQVNDVVEYITTQVEYADTVIANMSVPLLLDTNERIVLDETLVQFVRNSGLGVSQATYLSTFINTGNAYPDYTATPLDGNGKFVESFADEAVQAILTDEQVLNIAQKTWEFDITGITTAGQAGNELQGSNNTQIVSMLEDIQGSSWNNLNANDFDENTISLVNIAGPGFDVNTDSLSNVVQSMFDRGIVDVNTIKDLLE